jgi:hypothetical protein
MGRGCPEFSLPRMWSDVRLVADDPAVVARET